MKLWKMLPKRFLEKKNRQKGQAVVEFVLLLAVMALITFYFVIFMNRNLSRYWEFAANLVINDDPRARTVKLNP
jgi:hypothetical protein